MDLGYQLAGRTLTRVSRVIRRIRKMNGRVKAPSNVAHRDFYSIAIYTGDSPLDLEPTARTATPVIAAKDVTDVAATYVADPFMIRADGRWFMFFEILPKEIVKGVIGLATSRDGRKWVYERVVLEESFHLSYPCVFEADGEFFMIPESNQAGAVRLYKADPFPAHWTYVGNILDNVRYVDCTPFRFDDRWWLFAGCGEPPLFADTLRLFYADRLTGPWREHPASPVVSNNMHVARPGGRVVIWDNRLYRFCQDCSPNYGLGIRAYEITELTASVYRESLAVSEPILKASNRGWNSCGMHHIDPHPADGGGCIACVDGWSWGPIDS